MRPEQFAEALQEKGIELTKRQLEQFSIYYTTLVEWNEKMNLTAITDEEEVYVKHFFDSISVAFNYDLNAHESLTICDVGAGAGFPSIPLKICFPHISITIVDSLKKRIGFLEELAKQLELEDVHFYHQRAEQFGQDPHFREQFDIVLARAVARTSVLSELCIPLVKQNGLFLVMKGSQATDEHEDAGKAIHVLGGKTEEKYIFSLPVDNSERTIYHIRKIKSTPKKYPRKPGTPNKDPIM
ncbi:MAG TPA: 16S rRNA (guanine(527)-N(7))-methyltransferase RsmG [Bacillota bacterium]|nr:16S rRNA (guanine(527)-N(7))-methyltransferase RsmG [Bacillota bacterium]